jgi:hypothetical protein
LLNKCVDNYLAQQAGASGYEYHILANFGWPVKLGFLRRRPASPPPRSPGPGR